MHEPEITTLGTTQLVGLAKDMSLINNQTQSLWQQFSPRISEIKHKISSDKLSLQVYPKNYYKDFSPAKAFTKWAAVGVSNWDIIPEGLDRFTLESGLYAVFHYKGSSGDAASFFQYIFTEWIPKSKYVIDDRPHFEVLGDRYKNNDSNSEEDIWIPIKEKTI